MSQPRPQITAASPWRFPRPECRTLPNGLSVQTFQLPGQHVVSLLLVLDAPLGLEPPTAEGVATIAVRASDEGTLTHPGEHLVDLLEGAGAAYDGSAGASATIIGLDVPSTRLAGALPLLAEIATEAAFDPADVDRHVALRLAELDQAEVSAPTLAQLAVRAVLFDPGSRESRPLAGTRSGVGTVTHDMVQEFTAQHWRADVATLVVAGDLPSGIDALVDKAFSGWQPGTATVDHQPPVPEASATHRDGRRIVHLVDLPSAVQAEIRITGLGVDRDDPRFAPLQVAGTALGGSFGSRLNTVLREERGYTYGAHMAVSPSRSGGTWAVSTSVRTEVSAAALTDALQILTLAEPFTGDEIADAVNYQLGIAPLRYDTAGAIASQAASLVAAGQGPDFVNTHFERVRAVTPEAATRALRDVVRDDALHVVLVGNAAELTGQLEQAGYAVQPTTVEL